MRLAYFSPLPPQRSGIADYSSDLLPYLASLVDVTLFVPNPAQSETRLLDRFDVSSFEQYVAQRSDFDLAIYHVGNSEYHDEISRLAIAYPGVVVLHDFYLHHSVAQRTAGAGDMAGYIREMSYAQGVDGVRRAMAMSRGIEPPLFEVPLNNRLLDSSLGVIVHSHFAARLVRRQRYRGPIAILAQPIPRVIGRARRSELNIPEDAVLFGSFGLITKEKQIVSVLRELHRLRIEMPEAYLMLAGESMPDLPVEAIIRDFSLEDVVRLTGYVPQLADFIDWIHTADIVLNLRSPTVGETSATALRAMAAAKPLIVNDHGWYREIPADAAIKIPPGEDHALFEAMRLAGGSAPLRKRMGDAGLRYTNEVCNPQSVANAYHHALCRIQATAAIYG